MNRDDLIAFEAEIAEAFNAGRIRHPVHLSDGNEDALIDIFREVQPRDWVLGSWRAHYHCLLKGVPADELRAAIMAGGSMSLCFPAYRVLCSAIVGGVLPIALGIALQTKREGRPERVWCFMGDMTAETGIAHECMKYARNFDLPVTWVVEDNGVSVCTETKSAWGATMLLGETVRYEYRSRFPHAGAGIRVQF